MNVLISINNTLTKHWVNVLSALTMCVGVYIFWPDYSNFMDYGDPKKTYLKPPEGKAGDIVKFCIDDGSWLGLPIPGSSWLIEEVLCEKGGNPPVSLWRIQVPDHDGPIPPKCGPNGKPRPFAIPACVPGKFIVRSEIFSKRRLWWGKVIDVSQAGPTVIGTVLP